MNDVPPLGIRLLHALGREPDWSAMTAEKLAAYRDAENRKRSSRLIRLVAGFPDRGATIRWQDVPLPDREVPVRVYRPRRDSGDLPLVLHIHGGGFVGTAVQCDWVTSHLAARLPAVVVSVEHRLLAPGTPLQAAVDDGWDVLRHVRDHATDWGIDPARTALFGESCGALISALIALRTKDIRAQVLVNPALDVTAKMFDHDSMTQHAHSPMLTMDLLRFFHKLAIPLGTDPEPLSPLQADDLSGLAPALVVVPTVDPVADHGRRYVERLREAGTPARLTEHPGAPHAFLSLPNLVPQAKIARAEITAFLRERLAGEST